LITVFIIVNTKKSIFKILKYEDIIMEKDSKLEAKAGDGSRLQNDLF
jgi:hypothetical protein